MFPLIDTSSIMISSTARGIVCQDCGQFIPEQSFDDWLNGLPDHVCNPAQNLSTREIRTTATPPQRRVSSPRVLTTMTSTSARSTPIEQRAQRVEINTRGLSRPLRRGPHTPEPLSGIGLRRHQLWTPSSRTMFPITALDEIIQLRSDACCMMVNLGRLFRRVIQERAECKSGKTRARSTAITTA